MCPKDLKVCPEDASSEEGNHESAAEHRRCISARRGRLRDSEEVELLKVDTDSGRGDGGANGALLLSGMLSEAAKAGGCGSECGQNLSVDVQVEVGSGHSCVEGQDCWICEVLRVSGARQCQPERWTILS